MSKKRNRRNNIEEDEYYPTKERYKKTKTKLTQFQNINIKDLNINDINDIDDIEEIEEFEDVV